MLLMVLMDSPSRMVKCSKYIGRTAGTGASAKAATHMSIAAKQAARMYELRLRFRMESDDYSGFGTSTPV